MDRSTRFGSISSDSAPCSDSLSLRLHLSRLNLATEDNSLAHYAKGTRSGISGASPGYSPSTDCRQTVSGSISLPSPGFFSPFPHGTCTLSVDGTYLALEGGPPKLPQTCTWSGVLGNTIRKTSMLLFTGLSPSMVQLSRCFY